MSPTYLSKIERGDFKPPAEEKLKAIARELDQPVDEVLAYAGRIDSELIEIIQKRPALLAALLRATKTLGVREVERLLDSAKTGRKKRNQ